jgi:hypothetical protein
MSSAQLAAETKMDERYLSEWLASQAAGGYITYDEQNDKFSLSEEQAFTLAIEDSPAYLPEHLNWLWARSRRSHGSRNPFALAPAWAGMSMWTASFMDVKSSSVPPMPLIL